jgi:hypothetical protein
MWSEVESVHPSPLTPERVGLFQRRSANSWHPLREQETAGAARTRGRAWDFDLVMARRERSYFCGVGSSLREMGAVRLAALDAALVIVAAVREACVSSAFFLRLLPWSATFFHLLTRWRGESKPSWRRAASAQDNRSSDVRERSSIAVVRRNIRPVDLAMECTRWRLMPASWAILVMGVPAS